MGRAVQQSICSKRTNRGIFVTKNFRRRGRPPAAGGGGDANGHRRAARSESFAPPSFLMIFAAPPGEAAHRTNNAAPGCRSGATSAPGKFGGRPKPLAVIFQAASGDVFHHRHLPLPPPYRSISQRPPPRAWTKPYPRPRPATYRPKVEIPSTAAPMVPLWRAHSYRRCNRR